MLTINISAETYFKIRKQARGQPDTSTAQRLPDGTWNIEIAEDTAEALCERFDWDGNASLGELIDRLMDAQETRQ